MFDKPVQNRCDGLVRISVSINSKPFGVCRCLGRPGDGSAGGVGCDSKVGPAALDALDSVRSGMGIADSGPAATGGCNLVSAPKRSRPRFL